MAANIWRTRVRLSATAWGLRSSASSQAGVADAGGVVSVETMRSGRLYCGAGFQPASLLLRRVFERRGRLEACTTIMNEMIWINGDVMPLADARIGVEDRGYQFADGVYE